MTKMQLEEMLDQVQSIIDYYKNNPTAYHYTSRLENIADDIESDISGGWYDD